MQPFQAGKVFLAPHCMSKIMDSLNHDLNTVNSLIKTTIDSFDDYGAAAVVGQHFDFEDERFWCNLDDFDLTALPQILPHKWPASVTETRLHA